MSRSVRVTIKYFTIGGLLWFITLNIRPFLHVLEDRLGEFPFWVWEAEYPICSLINVFIVAFWGYQTYQRIIQKSQRKMFCAICYCSASWLAITCAQHTIFQGNNPLIQWIQRHLWYSYYVPWMAIPLLFLLITFYIGKSDREKIDRKFLLLWIPYGLINLGILTNDLHQQAFIFPEGIENWSTVYTHNWLFWVGYLWIAVVSVVAVTVIFLRTQVPSVKKFCIAPLMSLGMGQVLTLLAYLDIHYLRIAEVCIFAFGVTLEICIRANLIPNNVHYVDLIKSPEFQVYIYDDEYRLSTKPDDAEALPLKPAPFMLDDCHRVNSANVFGGHVYWIEDESEVHRLRGEMEDIRELLKEESSLLREENELKKRRISVSVKRQLYDSISTFATPLIKRMERDLDAMSLEKEPKQLAHICIQMAYLKRRSNMVLKKQDDGKLPLEELYNAVYEPFSYMEYLGIYAYPSGRLQGDEDGDLIIALYDLFYECVKAVYSDLSAILVNFSENADKAEVCFHMMMNLKDNLTEERSSRALKALSNISSKNPKISISTTCDEETFYTQITLRRGGAGLC